MKMLFLIVCVALASAQIPPESISISELFESTPIADKEVLLTTIEETTADAVTEQNVFVVPPRRFRPKPSVIADVEEKKDITLTETSVKVEEDEDSKNLLNRHRLRFRPKPHQPVSTESSHNNEISTSGVTPSHAETSSSTRKRFNFNRSEGNRRTTTTTTESVSEESNINQTTTENSVVSKIRNRPRFGSRPLKVAVSTTEKPKLSNDDEETTTKESVVNSPKQRFRNRNRPSLNKKETTDNNDSESSLNEREQPKVDNSTSVSDGTPLRRFKARTSSTDLFRRQRFPSTKLGEVTTTTTTAAPHEETSTIFATILDFFGSETTSSYDFIEELKEPISEIQKDILLNQPNVAQRRSLEASSEVLEDEPQLFQRRQRLTVEEETSPETRQFLRTNREFHEVPNVVNESKTSSSVNLKTINRYSNKNEDGSITWGFENDDGSFKEETRGADCVTVGRYGYINDKGELQETNYQSGNPCNSEQVENSRESQVGYYDYTEKVFVRADGRKVQVKVNPENKARG